MKESLNILVIDDEPSILEFFARLLRLKGFSVQTAASGAAALEIMSGSEVDLVITDIILPQMDGFQILDAVRQKNPDIPVIIMTGQGDAETVRKAMLRGADEYITKPFKREELSMVIERAVWKIVSKEPIIDSQ